MAFFSLSFRALLVPKRKSKTTFIDQIYLQSMGEMFSETNFDHSKWFSQPVHEKKCFSPKASNFKILKVWILKILCDVHLMAKTDVVGNFIELSSCSNL